MPPRSPDGRDGRMDPKVVARTRRLRKNQSDVEQKLWWILRNRNFGRYKFRRQFAVGKYSADFCCYEKKLIVEIDGVQHEEAFAEDQQREQFIRKAGFRIIRFEAVDVLKNEDEVLQEIFDFLRK